MSEERRSRLIDMIREFSFSKKKVVLASGRESDFFIDCKQTVLTAEGHWLAGELLHDMMLETFPCEAVAGVELGGCPLASAVSMVSYHRGAPIPAIYVRSHSKDVKAKRFLEGDRILTPGMKVVLVEDLITTGRDVLRAVGTLRDAGAEVVGVLALVDRDEGGRDAVRASVPCRTMATRKDFFPA